MRQAINFALEVLGIMDSVEKDKNISKALLDAGYIIDNKTNIKPCSLLLKGSGNVNSELN